MLRFRELAATIASLDAKIRPIAHRPIDISKPGWAANLAERVHPLDEAGVRAEAERALQQTIADYVNADDSEREFLRELFAQNPSFAWAASLPATVDTPEQFRQHLILFSLQDQGRDSRDALLELQALCQAAKHAGLSADGLYEAAALSSTQNKYGMGSTKDMLARAAEGWRISSPS